MSIALRRADATSAAAERLSDDSDTLPEPAFAAERALETSTEPEPERAERLATAPARPFRLTVLDGLHAGAVVMLAPGSASIGAADAADVILADLGPDDGLTIDLDDAGARVVGRDGAALRLPIDIAAGPVSLRLEDLRPVRREPIVAHVRAPRPADVSGLGRAPTLALGALVASVLGAALLALALPAREDPATTADGKRDRFAEFVAQAAPALALGDDPTGAPRLAGLLEAPDRQALALAIAERFPALAPDLPIILADVATPEIAERALAARLADADLADRVSLARDNAALRLTGALDADGRAALADIEAWFAARYGAALPLLAAVTAADAAPAPTPRLGLQAVWVGRDPYAVAADGRRVRPGEPIGDGWRVVAITPERLTLARGEATHEIDLAIGGAR